MVLCHDTDHVLLDEPLNNQDMKHAVAMMRLVRRAADELGKTVVLVLHDISFAACCSDHVVAMRDGVVVHQGAPEAIMTAEAMRVVYDIDVAVHRIGGRPIAVYYTSTLRARRAAAARTARPHRRHLRLSSGCGTWWVPYAQNRSSHGLPSGPLIRWASPFEKPAPRGMVQASIRPAASTRERRRRRSRQRPSPHLTRGRTLEQEGVCDGHR